MFQYHIWILLWDWLPIINDYFFYMLNKILGLKLRAMKQIWCQLQGPFYISRTSDTLVNVLYLPPPNSFGLVSGNTITILIFILFSFLTNKLRHKKTFQVKYRERSILCFHTTNLKSHIQIRTCSTNFSNSDSIIAQLTKHLCAV